MPRTDIVQTKNIIRLVKDKYNFDLSPLVITSLRYKLDNVISNNRLKDFDHLYESLNGVPAFFDVFLSEIFYASAELFRDPEMWVILKNDIIPLLIGKHKKISVLISQSSCGSDLFSLSILMNEMRWYDKIDLHFTWISEANKKSVLKGKIEKNLQEISLKNIKEVFPDYSNNKYILQEKRKYYFNNRYLQNITSSKHDFCDGIHPGNYHLILCRNRFLFFNPDYQNLMLDKLVRDLRSGGFLVTGFKEDISDYLAKNDKLEITDPLEKIYKKAVE